MAPSLASLIPSRFKRNSKAGNLDASTPRESLEARKYPPQSPQSPHSQRERIDFFTRDMASYWLSNGSEHHVVFDGVRYPTAEHLFQSLKFLEDHPEIANKVRKASTPLDAIHVARTYSAQVRPDWITDGVNVVQMRMVLLMKFTQHSDLFLALLETGDAEIVHANPNDAFWGSGAQAGELVAGRNMLGRTLVQTRELLRVAAGVGAGSGSRTI